MLKEFLSNLFVDRKENCKKSDVLTFRSSNREICPRFIVKRENEKEGKLSSLSNYFLNIEGLYNTNEKVNEQNRKSSERLLCFYH